MDERNTVYLSGGPLCGAMTCCAYCCDDIAVPMMLAGDFIEYRYHRSERISECGHVVFDYQEKRVLKVVQQDDV